MAKDALNKPKEMIGTVEYLRGILDHVVVNEDLVLADSSRGWSARMAVQHQESRRTCRGFYAMRLPVEVHVLRYLESSVPVLPDEFSNEMIGAHNTRASREEQDSTLLLSLEVGICVYCSGEKSYNTFDIAR